MGDAGGEEAGQDTRGADAGKGGIAGGAAGGTSRCRGGEAGGGSGADRADAGGDGGRRTGAPVGTPVRVDSGDGEGYRYWAFMPPQVSLSIATGPSQGVVTEAVFEITDTSRSSM